MKSHIYLGTVDVPFMSSLLGVAMKISLPCVCMVMNRQVIEIETGSQAENLAISSNSYVYLSL